MLCVGGQPNWPHVKVLVSETAVDVGWVGEKRVWLLITVIDEGGNVPDRL